MVKHEVTRCRQPNISRGSSVVERIIGNDEVGSSILPRGTSSSDEIVFEKGLAT